MDWNFENLNLHPLTKEWFTRSFHSPTDVQKKGWNAIKSGRHTLIAAPTGSGKTLTAFLVALDQLIQEDLRFGGVIQGLADETRILYVSPLKALSHDVQKNLESPLSEIQKVAFDLDIPEPQIRTMVRTGDTPTAQRALMLRKPPHVLVTTPESLFLLLTTERGRLMLSTVKTVIIDEIHALVRDKRGAHLALSLARLDRLCKQKPQRIGLSATQKPLDRVAQFLTGMGPNSQPYDCQIIDVGHQRALDLEIEGPTSALSAVLSHDQWEEVYKRLVELIQNHRSTLVFVNTRKLAERVSFHLSQILGEDHVQSHHGSLSREIRLKAEERLKKGELKALVATASLELGIDVGYVDLVCQIGSPKSIATFLQRVGRSGHTITGVPKGRLFVLTRDELVEAAALLLAVSHGELDKLIIPEKPLDILAQHVIAETALSPVHWNELFELARTTEPFRTLEQDEFISLINSLAQGYAPGRERRAYVGIDRLTGILTARKGARLAALTSGGAIPELGDFRVVTEDEGTLIGSVNEDFAIESSRGDIFLLGNNSWQIVQLRGTDLVVRDAHGAPPTIPFWFGEAPGRSPELSNYVGLIREKIASQLVLPQDPDHPLWSLEEVEQLSILDPECYKPARQYLQEDLRLSPWLSLQLVHYLAVQKAAIGVIPTTRTIVFERFFDDTGGMQLVIHAPLGIRINRGFGLALRKRFCRSFDFELQASADNDGVVLSLSEQQSFPIEQLFTFLTPENVVGLLEQAILQTPLFNVRWRWNANRSLAVLRSQAGKKIPPALQRFRADDLMTAVFPAQTQCKENVVGDIPIPDHPLVRQTMHDCLWEAIDLGGLIHLLGNIRDNNVTLVAVESREPSPFAYQLLNAMPYAFLDDAPLEERRTRALSLRRTLPLGDLKNLAQLSPDAIAIVRNQVCPDIHHKEELADYLSLLSVINPLDLKSHFSSIKQDDTHEDHLFSADSPSLHLPQLERWFHELVAENRAFELQLHETPHLPALTLWVSTQQWDLVEKAYEGRPYRICPDGFPHAPSDEFNKQLLSRNMTHEDAVEALIKGYLDTHPIALGMTLVEVLGLPSPMVAAILAKLESQGSIIRGLFTNEPNLSEKNNFADDQAQENLAPRLPLSKQSPLQLQWCERRLLARIHKLTIETLRSQIKPVTAGEYFHFLASLHHAGYGETGEGQETFLKCLSRCEGFEAPAGAWESEIFGLRIRDYQPRWLDEATLSGQWVWGRLSHLSLPAEENMMEERKDRGSGQGGLGMSRVVSVGFTERLHIQYFLRSHDKKLIAQQKTKSLPSLPQSESLVPGLVGDLKKVYDVLKNHGALFFSDLLSHTKLLESQLQNELSELARRGLIHADGFGAIRHLVSPKKEGQGRNLPARRTRFGRPLWGGAQRDTDRIAYQKLAEGRWSLFPPQNIPYDEAEETGHMSLQDGLHPQHVFWAELLLRRYGIVFKALLTREAEAPSWGQLLRVYRVLEARGEVRGGQFIAGPWGEQFASEETIAHLRSFRGKKGLWTVIHAADPLNLVGILLAGERIAASHKVVLAICDGELVAKCQGTSVTFCKQLSAELEGKIRQSLVLKGSFRSQFWCRSV